MTGSIDGLPPLSTLVVFEAAYRKGSFTRAADELFMSQASVSRRIRELEDDLGVQLFTRLRHSVAPTAEADAFARSVRLSLGELSAAAGRIRRGSESETLTVLCSLSLTSALVAPALAELQAATDGLKVQLLSECDHIEATTEDFDIAIQYGPPTSPRFHVEHLIDEGVVPVCTPAMLDCVGRPVSAKQLVELPLLHVDYTDPTWPTWKSALEAAGADVPEESRTMVYTSYRACIDAAARGEGVALGWDRSLTDRVASGDLVAIDELALRGAASINAYLPRDRPESELNRRLVEMLLESVSGSDQPPSPE